MTDIALHVVVSLLSPFMFYDDMIWVVFFFCYILLSLFLYFCDVMSGIIMFFLRLMNNQRWFLYVVLDEFWFVIFLYLNIIGPAGTSFLLSIYLHGSYGDRLYADIVVCSFSFVSPSSLHWPSWPCPLIYSKIQCSDVARRQDLSRSSILCLPVFDQHS